ncbi:putative nucleoside transporter [Daldinia caldariorum]|uniref:putative nucleoside transporter n=1 Tax=Daldinia caldariorum TaxID=326644 RepID=UPI0020083068|nr:putative nucleoside transporter [Daldinia caldariorum]KAI1467809.1 putative nucleoside transporter [Daldinia caldariorum]
MDRITDEEENVPQIVGVDADTSSEETQMRLKKTGFLAQLRSYEEALDRKLGVESHSIERKLPGDRNPFYTRWSGQLAIVSFWVGGCMNLGSFASGFIGWEFGLDLRQSILVIIFGSVVGGAVTSWCATMGPPTGLRQVSICRYSLGWYPSKVIAILNVIQQIGWCASGSITGGQALYAFSDGKVGSQLGVVIVSIMSLGFSFFGLKAVYIFEKFAWLVFLGIFLIILGEIGRFADLSAPSSAKGPSNIAGAVLTYFGVMYGSSASCAGESNSYLDCYVSDFYAEHPANIAKTKIFLLTFVGLFVSTCLSAIAGAIAASALHNNPQWNEQYEVGVGFLLQTMIHPYRLAKAILFLLMFASVGLNCGSMYSAGLSIQQASYRLAAVPRFVWEIFCFAAVIALGLAGSDRLLVFLQNFLSLLGYYATAVFVCLFTEHYLFRDGSFGSYDLENWNTRSMLPVGYAGSLAFACGIVGAVLGMSTTWYTGVIAKRFGELGGDIGNELCFFLTLVAYVPARYAERRWMDK